MIDVPDHPQDDECKEDDSPVPTDQPEKREKQLRKKQDGRRYPVPDLTKRLSSTGRHDLLPW
jgi:hypothetical protein